MTTVTTAAAGIGLLLQLIEQAARVSAIIKQAQAEGREELTSAEMAQVLAANDDARVALVDAIAHARAAGR